MPIYGFDDNSRPALTPEDQKKESNLLAMRFAGVKPDEAAENAAIARRLDEEYELVKTNPETFSQRLAREQKASVLEDNPELRRWLSGNLSDADMASDDFDALGPIGKAARTLTMWKDAAVGGFQAGWITSKTGELYGRGEGFWDNAHQLTDAEKVQAKEWDAEAEKLTDQYSGNWLFDAANMGSTMASGVWMHKEEALIFAAVAAASAVFAAPTGGTSFSAVLGTAVNMGLTGAMIMSTRNVEGGLARKEALEAGASEEEAEVTRNIAGWTNAAIELGAIKLLKHYAIAPIVKTFKAANTKAVIDVVGHGGLTKLGLGQAFARGAETYAAGMVSEPATEVMQEITTALAVEFAKTATDPSLASLTAEELYDRAYETAVTTMRAQAILGIIPGALRTKAHYSMARRAKDFDGFLDAVAKGADVSKLRERAPGAFGRFVASVAGEERKTLYVPGDKMAQAMEQAGVTAEDLENAGLESVAEQVRNAGGNADVRVAIPIGDYAARLSGTKLDRELRSHIATEEDGLTFGEEMERAAREREYAARLQQAANSAVAGQIAEGQEGLTDVEKEFLRVRTDIERQMLATGNAGSPAEVSVQATLMTRSAANLANRAGMTLTQLIENSPLGYRFTITDEKGRALQRDTPVDADGGMEVLAQVVDGVEAGLESGEAEEAFSPILEAVRMTEDAGERTGWDKFARAVRAQKGDRRTLAQRMNEAQAAWRSLSPRLKEAMLASTSPEFRAVAEKQPEANVRAMVNFAVGNAAQELRLAQIAVDNAAKDPLPVPAAGESVEYGEALKEFVGENKEREAAVKDLLRLLSTEYQKTVVTQEGVKSDNQTLYQKFINKAVQDAAKKAGIDLLDYANPVTADVLLNTVVNDALYAAKENPSSIGWYDKRVRLCLAYAGTIWPELNPLNGDVFDANEQFRFIYVLATTSNGLKVSVNLPLAVKIYEEYKKTGVMPAEGAGTAAKAIEETIEAFKDRAAEFSDIDQMRLFYMTVWSVKELTQMGYEASGENAEEDVMGAAIMGPKIGNGFFANLNRNFDRLTMDRWFMRTWGRWTGSLIEFNRQSFIEKLDQLRAVCAEIDAAAKSGDKKAIELKNWLKETGAFDIDLVLARSETSEDLAAAEEAYALGRKLTEEEAAAKQKAFEARETEIEREVEIRVDDWAQAELGKMKETHPEAMAENLKKSAAGKKFREIAEKSVRDKYARKARAEAEEAEIARLVAEEAEKPEDQPRKTEKEIRAERKAARGAKKKARDAEAERRLAAAQAARVKDGKPEATGEDLENLKEEIRDGIRGEELKAAAQKRAEARTLAETATAASATWMPASFRKQYAQKFDKVFGHDKSALHRRFYVALGQAWRSRLADKQAPASGGERAAIRGIFDQALGVLHGYEGMLPLTMADLQASLWYAEKKIYENLKEDEGVFVSDYGTDDAPDYANVMREVALDRGVSPEKLEDAKQRLEDAIEKETRNGRTGGAAPHLDSDGKDRFFRHRIFGNLRGNQELSLANSKESGKRSASVYREKRRVEAAELRASVGGAGGGTPELDKRAGGRDVRPRKKPKLALRVIAEWSPGRSVKDALCTYGIRKAERKGYRSDPDTDARNKEVEKTKKAAAPTFVEYAPTEAAANKFLEKLKAAKAALGAPGACVEEKSVDELLGRDKWHSQCRLFLSKDGKSGFVIKNGDDLVSVFSQGASGDAVVECAIAAGARRLDCFNTILPAFYAAHGFRPVARIKFVDKFAPPDWDFDYFAGKKNVGTAQSPRFSKDWQGGRPDVIFMVLDPGQRACFSAEDIKDIPYSASWADAEAIQVAETAARAPEAARIQRTVEVASGLKTAAAAAAEEAAQAQLSKLRQDLDAPSLSFSDRLGLRSFGGFTPAEWMDELRDADQLPHDSVSAMKLSLVQDLLVADSMDDVRRIPESAREQGFSQEVLDWFQTFFMEPIEADQNRIVFAKPSRPLTAEEQALDLEFERRVLAGDIEGARAMLEAKMAAVGLEGAIPDQCATYRVRVGAAPKKTIRVFKTFYVDADGDPSALFVGGADKIPMGVWLDGVNCWHFTDPTNGRKYVPSTKNPNGEGGKTGDQRTFPPEARQYLISRGFIKEGSNAGKVTALKYRPGWHAADLPFFPQGGKKVEGSNYGNVHRWNQAVFECEFDADNDFTDLAQAQSKARNKAGGLYAKEGDLEYMPEHGFYRYSTNPQISGHEDTLGNWMISGSMRIVRPLTQEECDSILIKNGLKPQEWEQGKMSLADLGVQEGGRDDSARKTIAPVTRNAQGEVIPLSDRFSPGRTGVLYQVDDSLEDEDKLVVVHKISEENLKSALALGGLPAPSLGITKASAPYDGFGPIALIGTSGMIDPANGTAVFSFDGYTSRFPQVHAVDSAYLRQKCEERLFGNYNALQRDTYAWVKKAEGKLKTELQSLRDEFTKDADELTDFVLDEPTGPEAKAKLLAMLRRHVSAKLWVIWANGEWGSFADRLESGGCGWSEAIDSVFRDNPDLEERLEAFAEQNAYGLTFVDTPKIWVDGEPVPLTLENAVAAMKPGKLTEYSAEKFANAQGFGPLQARLAKQYGSLDEIKADRGRVVAPEEQGAILGDAREELDQIAIDLSDMYEDQASFDDLDYSGIDHCGVVWRALQAGAHEGGSDFQAIMGVLNEEIERWHDEEGISAPDRQDVQELAERIESLLENLKDNVTDYLEAKPHRAVGFGEFRGAVVPEGTSAEIIKTLEDLGLEVLSYADGGQSEAISELSAKLQAEHGDVLFQPMTKNQVTNKNVAWEFGLHKVPGQFLERHRLEKPEVSRGNKADQAVMLEKLRDGVTNESSGFLLTTRGNDAAKSLTPKKYKGDLRLMYNTVVANFEAVARDAVLIESSRDVQHANNDVQGVHYFAYAFEADGKSYLVRLTVRDYKGGDAGERTAIHAVDGVDIEVAAPDARLVARPAEAARANTPPGDPAKPRAVAQRDGAASPSTSQGFSGDGYILTELLRGWRRADGGRYGDPIDPSAYAEGGAYYDPGKVQQKDRVARDEQGRAYPRGEFDRRMNRITLTPNANLSTFSHEMGHWYFETLMALAETDGASESLKQDAATLMKELGIRGFEDWKTMGSRRLTQAHETFAAWVEEYLATAKPPVPELADVMRRLASWICDVYRDLTGKASVHDRLSGRLRRNYGFELPEISDEVRACLDRMVASEDEIEAARAIEGGEEIFSERPAFVTDEDWQEYLEARRASVAEARETLAQKKLEGLKSGKRAYSRELRKLQAERRDLRRAAEQDARGEVLQPGTLWWNMEQVKGLPRDMRPSSDEVRACIGDGQLDGVVTEEQVKELIRKGYLAGAGKGMPLGEFVLSFGQPDFSAWARAYFAEALNPTLEDEVRRRADKTMEAEFPLYASDAAIEEKAAEAAANEGEMRGIAAELNFLRDILKGDKETNRITADAADAQVGAEGQNPESIGQLLGEARRQQKRLDQAMRRDDDAEIAEAQAQRDLAIAKARQLAKLAKGTLTASRVDVEAASGAAKSALGRMKVREVSAKRFMNIARKYQREAVNAYQKGDIQTALKAKEGQLLYTALAKSAIDFQNDEVRRLKAAAKKFAAPDAKLSKTRSVDIIAFGRAVLGRFGLVSEKRAAGAAETLEKIRRYDPTTAGLLDNAMAATADPVSWRELQVDDVRDLAQQIDAIWQISRDTKAMEIDGRTVKLEDAAALLGAQLEHRYGGKKRGSVLGTDETSEKQKTLKCVSHFFAALRRVESWCQDMDRDNPAQPFTKLIWRPVSDGVNLYNIAKKNYYTRLRGIFDRYETEGAMTPGQIVAAELINPETGEPFVFSSKAALIGALLHTGNASNKNKLVAGYGWGQVDEETGAVDWSLWDSFVQRMVDGRVLTERDFEFCQEVWDLLEDMKPDAQRAHHKMTGLYFDEITQRPFTVKFPSGEVRDYRGGYVPATVDRNKEDRNVADEERDLAAIGTSFDFPNSGNGFTKARTAGYRKPLVLSVDMIPAHIDQVLRYTYIQPAAVDVYRLVKTDDVRKMINSYGNSEVVDGMLVPWLSRTVRQKVTIPTAEGGWRAIENATSQLRSRTGLAIMAGNLSNALQQLSGFSLTLAAVKPGQLAGAVKALVFGEIKAGDIKDKSAFMASRLDDNQVAALERAVEEFKLCSTKLDKVKAFMNAHGYFLQEAFQKCVDIPTWVAAYNQALAEGLSEEEAVQRADGVVRMTQSSNAAQDVSSIETGNALQRSIMMFFNYFDMIYNLSVNEFGDAFRKQKYGRAAWCFATIILMPTLISDIIKDDLLGGGDEDDDDDDPWYKWITLKILSASVRGASGMIPGGGAIGTLIDNKITGKPAYGSYSRLNPSPVLSALENVTRVPGDLADVIVDGKHYKRAIKDGLMALSLCGYPVYQLGKPLGYLADIAEGKAKPEGPADIARGLVIGREPK